MLIWAMALGDNPWFQLFIGLCMLFFCLIFYNLDNLKQMINHKNSQNGANAAELSTNEPQQDTTPANVENDSKNRHQQPVEEKQNQSSFTNPANSVELSLKSDKKTAPIQEIEDLEKWDLVIDNIRVT